jgi:hypothetical protein
MTSMSLILESSMSTTPVIDMRADQVQGAIAASAILADAEIDADELRWQLEWSRRNVED